MVTLQKIGRTVQSLCVTYITKAKHRRFMLGVEAFSLREFTSLNTAGRLLGVGRFTGEARVRRMAHDNALGDSLQRLLLHEGFGGRAGQCFCSLDHSQFGCFCIAVLAVSHRKGRAIPVWVQVNVSEAALIKPLLSALEELFGVLEHIAGRMQLVLVMDRWFASDRLFALFEVYGIQFIARTKGDKLVQLPWDPSWRKEPIADISHEELDITYHKHKLRLIRSDYKEGMKGAEPWFLLTNIPDRDRAYPESIGLTRRQILNRYAERFEIEEAFKDIKWLNRLNWQSIRKPTAIRNLLLFVLLGWWLLWRYYDTRTYRMNAKVHPKKRLSWYRLAWEQVQTMLQAQLHAQLRS